jgi:hypothetical protein
MSRDLVYVLDILAVKPLVPPDEPEQGEQM